MSILCAVSRALTTRDVHSYRTAVVGGSGNFAGGLDWLRENGVRVIDLHEEGCIRMLGDFIRAHPELWAEDIGEA